MTRHLITFLLLPSECTIFQLHVEVSFLALVVHVLLPHDHRVHPEPVRNILDPGLGHEHTLRAAESSERGVRLDVGFAAAALGADVFDVVGVVRLEQGPVHHGQREVRRVAGIVVLKVTAIVQFQICPVHAINSEKEIPIVKS